MYHVLESCVLSFLKTWKKLLISNSKYKHLVCDSAKGLCRDINFLNSSVIVAIQANTFLSIYHPFLDKYIIDI